MATISKISQYTDIAHVQKINEIIDAINTYSNKEEYELPAATNDSLGGVIVGSNISLETNGTISIDKEDVINVLKNIYDPEISVNIIVLLAQRHVSESYLALIETAVKAVGGE